MKIVVLGIRGIPNIQGGAERHVEELYSRIARRNNIKITVLARTPYVSNNMNGEWNNIRIRRIWCPKQKNFETICHTILSSINAVLQKPDIVHFHNIGAAFGILFVKMFGIKTVLTYHSVNYDHAKWSHLA